MLKKLELNLKYILKSKLVLYHQFDNPEMIIDFCSVVRKNLKYTLLPEPAWLAVKAFAK